MAYSKEFKHRIVKHVKLGVSSIADVARIRKILRSTIYRWLEKVARSGVEALENKKTGPKATELNEKFKTLVFQLWTSHSRGAHKMWLYLKYRLGFAVSERQIRKVYHERGLKMNKRKRPSQIKFVKYEYPRPNMLWHTDWTVCPFTKMQLIAFIDDYSRYIVHAEYFSNATTENTLLAFQAAIAKFGAPEAILTDNGVQFTPARAEVGPFTRWCEEHGIKHILGRIHHPQTNGKIERWFGTYKQEFAVERDTLNTFVKYYNEERLHQGIGYLVPAQRFKCLKNAV